MGNSASGHVEYKSGDKSGGNNGVVGAVGQLVPILLGGFQTEADSDGMVYLRHNRIVKMTDLFFQSLLIEGSDLFKQDDGVTGKSACVIGE